MLRAILGGPPPSEQERTGQRIEAISPGQASTQGRSMTTAPHALSAGLADLFGERDSAQDRAGAERDEQGDGRGARRDEMEAVGEC
jgi:hypothetical protein